jgi:hypothetical protein
MAGMGQLPVELPGSRSRVWATRRSVIHSSPHRPNRGEPGGEPGPWTRVSDGDVVGPMTAHEGAAGLLDALVSGGVVGYRLQHGRVVAQHWASTLRLRRRHEGRVAEVCAYPRQYLRICDTSVTRSLLHLNNMSHFLSCPPPRPEQSRSSRRRGTRRPADRDQPRTPDSPDGGRVDPRPRRTGSLRPRPRQPSPSSRGGVRWDEDR